MLSAELAEFEEAKKYYLQALEIFVEFEDRQRLDLTIGNLANLYQQTQDESLITEIATMFEMTEAEVRELFDRYKE
ncbi:MAG: hypothetical protein AAFY50_21010 [Cyanobacteria bacterium J06648_1]